MGRKKAADPYVESLKEDYSQLYDDVATITMRTDSRLGEKAKEKMLRFVTCMMADRHSIVGYGDYDRGRGMFFLTSRKFRAKAERMTKGTRVSFRDPSFPDKHMSAVVQSDGVYHYNGIAVLDLLIEGSPEVHKMCTAVYWSPAE